MTENAYRAVFFDLDGTLLPMDLEEFLGAYFKDVSRYVMGRGKSFDDFMAGFKSGIKAMGSHDGQFSNAEMFWQEFFKHVQGGPDEWLPLFERYYATDFARIGEGVQPNPAASLAVETLVAKGYPLVLATQPMFPLEAVKQRLKWAGVRDSAFARITHFANSMATKPNMKYVAENLAACGLSGKDVLMVGNNTVEDGVFANLGVDVYLVTDQLLNPAGIDIENVKHGTMEEFAAWASQLPDCANPAPHAKQDLVPPLLREVVFSENVLPGALGQTEGA